MSERKVKWMDIKEFREKGYLQEVNRRFFHPLGLALAISIDDESGEEKLAGIWDDREDKEGIYYDLSNSDVERKERFLNNYNFIESEFENRREDRIEKIGFFIEDIKRGE